MTRSSGDMEGEVIDSWELSPDKLTLTAKVTKDVAFAPIAPVNGRAVDAHDVAYITDNIEAHPILDLVAHYHANGGRFFGGDAKVDTC